MWKYMFLSCFLCGVRAQNASYFVLLPSTIRPGLSLNIGVNILKSDGDVTVTASLQRIMRIPIEPLPKPLPVREVLVPEKEPEPLPNNGEAIVPPERGPEPLPNNREAIGPPERGPEPLPIRKAPPSFPRPPPPHPPFPRPPFEEPPTEAVTISTSRIVTRQGEPTTLMLEVPLDLQTGNYEVLVEGGGGLEFNKQQSVRLKTKSVSVFIQTDKGIYKPRQTVHLRTFAVFPDLKPFNGTFDIEIFDPNSNKIKQWLNVREDSNIVAMDLTLSEQPVMGNWRIRSTANGQVIERLISVEEFVLPKFEVKIELPPFGLTRDQELRGKITATYTFGKGVEGTVNLRIRRNDKFFQSSRCRDEPIIALVPFQINGNASFSVPMTQLLHLVSCEQPIVRETRNNTLAENIFLDQRTILVEANVTESLTGNTRKGSNTIKYFEQEYKLEWMPSNSKNFKPGLWYNAFLKVSTQDGRPTGKRQFVTIRLMTSFDNCEFLRGVPTMVTQRKPEQPYPDFQMRVPSDGVINWSNLIPADADSVTIRAELPGALSKTHGISKMHSPSNSYMQANLFTSDLKVGDEATFEILSTAPMDSVVYQIYSRGNMVTMAELDGQGGTTLFISVPMTSQMAPNAKFIIYSVQPDGELVIDSVSFTVQGIFQNDVSILMDKASAEPGEAINIVVNADPNSMVSLLSVDQSVLLLKSGNDITSAEVEREINSFDERPGLRNPELLFFRYPVAYGGTDASQILQNAGVVALTDASIHRVKSCIFQSIRPLFARGPSPIAFKSGVAPPVILASPAPEAESTRVRTLFPDTWLWTNQTSGPDGKATFTATVPDTITSWITSAFAMNPDSGLGVPQSTAKLQVFLPFFVSLNLPFSVVRGEEVVLQAIVFNFLDGDTEVDVTLARSDSFNSIVVGTGGEIVATSSDQVQKIPVNAGEAKSVFFPVIPTEIGHIDISVTARAPLAGDALVRQLLVVPEGVPQEYALSFLIDLTDTDQYRNTVDLPFPGEIVDGSRRVTVSALGDLMGPTVNNLDKLLKLPSGCGEQNMISFAPDVFILKYLNYTDQLTDAIRQKGINFLEIGYQRELTYQHRDGSFSAFGERDRSGSMWLSAFVLTSFIKAKPFIFIDDRILTRTVAWIIKHQSKDGSFPEPGRVIHTEMQGGSGSMIALTAYVLTALLQKENVTDSQQEAVRTAVSKARAFVEAQLGNIQDTYSLAISTYALTLAGSPSSVAALARLDRRAIIQDGLKHWEVPETPVEPSPNRRRFWKPPNAAKARNVELTAYVLLIQADGGNVTESLPIAKWLTGQRNANGGFVSTQDTVVGLEALSEFASLVYSPVFDVNVVVSADPFRHTFPVSSSNALILQMVNLDPIPSSLTIEANGNGISLVEVSVSYNVHSDSQEPSFDIRTRITDETFNGFTLETCASYLKSDMSGMVVQETGIPAGFEADVDSITKFRGLKRIETLDRKVVLYFDTVTSVPVCVSLNIVRSGLVAKTKPVAVKIYQYYSPESQVTVFYSSALLSTSSFCDICAECDCPRS